MMAQNQPKPFNAALSSFSGQPGDVEAVIISYQQNMLKMVTDFSRAQQTVMLAYLEGVQSSRVDQVTSTAQTVLLTEQQTLFSYERSIEPSTGVTEISQPAEALLEQAMPVLEQAIPDSQPDFVQLDPSTISPEICDVEVLISVFTELVSERTGYPLDMLDPTLDLESDLGIDSIKRIEILSNFRKRLPEAVQVQMEEKLEEIAGVKTLSEIFEWIRTTCVSQ